MPDSVAASGNSTAPLTTGSADSTTPFEEGEEITFPGPAGDLIGSRRLAWCTNCARSTESNHAFFNDTGPRYHADAAAAAYAAMLDSFDRYLTE